MLSKKIRTLALDGCMEDKQSYAIGTYRGFIVLIDTNYRYSNCLQVQISAHREDDLHTSELRTQLGILKQEFKNKVVSAEVAGNTVTLILKNLLTQKKTAQLLDETLRRVVDFLRSRMYVSGCMECGTTGVQVEPYFINDHRSLLCPECVEKVQMELEQQKAEIRARKSKLIPGFVGALLGAAIGAVIWILIAKLGYIAGLAGLVMGVLAMKGYEKLGDCLDVKGVLISLIVVIFGIYFANKVAWSWEAYDALKDYGYTFFECYQDLDYILEVSELTASFTRDMLVGYGLTLLWSFAPIIGAFRKSQGSYTIKKAK